MWSRDKAGWQEPAPISYDAGSDEYFNQGNFSPNNHHNFTSQYAAESPFAFPPDISVLQSVLFSVILSPAADFDLVAYNGRRWCFDNGRRVANQTQPGCPRRRAQEKATQKPRSKPDPREPREPRSAFNICCQTKHTCACWCFINDAYFERPIR
jgi:hypothetical protein